MHLKELEIFGFKSFPDKTALKFEPGITVIVGPNGCGKSNVLDSIKWALGEQSPKSLRGSKMEDIIFNGTENHPPLNYAEVTMTFENEDGYLPIDYKEVAVSRRLYRSGESEYYINKNIVRLKDINDLFMGTGIGESTYSFVEQGKIDVFINHKPEDKRLIFDEASGIVKYKERKRETMRRMEETDENLLRLEDIISEVKRQIRYLERQVEKTRKYKEAQESLIEIEKKIATLQFREQEGKVNAMLEELNGLKVKESAQETSLHAGRTAWDALAAKIRQTQKDLQETSSQVFTLSSQIETSAERINSNTQRIKELDTRNEQIEQNKKTLADRLSLQDSRIEEEKSLLAALETDVQKANVQISSVASERSGVEKASHEAKTKISTEKTVILDCEGKCVSLRNSLVELQTNLASLANRKKRLLLDKARIEGFLRENKENLEKAAAETAMLAGELQTLKDLKNSLIAQEQALAGRKEELQGNVISKEKELIELNSYFEFLKDLRVKYDTFSVKKRMTVVFSEEPKDINKLIISLKDVQFQKENNTYKAEIEAKVIALEEGQIQEKIAVLEKDLLVLRQGLSDLENQKQAITTQAVSQNTTIEEKERIWLQRSQEKEAFSRDHTRFSEENELIEKEIAANRQEIETLETKQKALDSDIALAEETLHTAQLHLQNLQEDILKFVQRMQEIDIETAKLETHKQSLQREKESLSSKINAFAEEKENLQRSIAEAQREKEANIQRAASMRQELTVLEGAIAANKEKIEGLSLKKRQAENEAAGLEGRLEEDRKALDTLEKDLEDIKTVIGNKKMEIQGLDYEKEKIKDYLRQVYHVEFDPQAFAQQLGDLSQEHIADLSEKKETFKKRIDSLGEVNLVAIEEFEELRKRDEFLDKQKADLVESKENLKKAIAKINRTSRELFLETFTKVEEEFKKNFRFLFGGGRAQLILLDPENVLESGVEIEVQPPGKKLQNVSLLSGGEKALTAISLVFAIFRVRPSPLCVLDEIDAPLDEANVDRFNNILKDFAATSQFLLITHNKKTMAKADVLYGVTMQEKGVSKLVSVKFDEKPKTAAATVASSESSPAQ